MSTPRARKALVPATLLSFALLATLAAGCSGSAEDVGASEGAQTSAKAKEPEVATLCNTAMAEQVVFSCKTASKKIISICGYKGAVQYRFGTSANVELELPKEMGPIADKPQTAESGSMALGGPGGGGAWATFHNGAYDYSVFTINASRGMDSEGRSLGTENTSGVVVTKQGQKVALVKCVEEPKSELPTGLIAPSDKRFDIDLVL